MRPFVIRTIYCYEDANKLSEYLKFKNGELLNFQLIMVLLNPQRKCVYECDRDNFHFYLKQT